MEIMKGFVPSISLYKYLNQSPPDNILHIHNFIKSVAEKIKKKMRPGNSRMAQIYLEVDRAIKEDKSIAYHKPVCKKGCTHCCHQRVGCTKEEIVYALAYAKKMGCYDKINLSRIPPQLGINGDTHWALPWEESSCAFLDEESNACLVYPARPLACRCLYVKTPPEYCKKGEGDGFVAHVIAVHAECIATAYATAYHYETGLLPELGLADHLASLIEPPAAVKQPE